jgi:hypothetical protein
MKVEPAKIKANRDVFVKLAFIIFIIRWLSRCGVNGGYMTSVGWKYCRSNNKRGLHFETRILDLLSLNRVRVISQLQPYQIVSAKTFYCISWSRTLSLGSVGPWVSYPHHCFVYSSFLACSHSPLAS